MAHSGWPDEKPRGGRGVVLPILFIVVGSVLLLNNLGILTWSVWSSLAQLWPVILVLLGIELILGRRTSVPGGIIAIVALVVVVAWASHQARAPAAQVATATPAAPGTNQAVMLGPATPGNATSQVVVPLGDTRGATISLNAGTGDLRVGALPADNANLARADADLSDGEQLIKKSSTVDGKTELTLNAEGSTGFFWPFGRQQHHEDSLAVSLTPKVPLTLQTNLGAGNSELDLTNLSVQTLDVNRGGGGETIVHLPSGAGTTRANVRIGAGDLTLVVPPDVGAYLHTSKGLVSVDLPAGRFTTVSDGYQSANYATAANQVDVYLQMGVGHVDVQ